MQTNYSSFMALFVTLKETQLLDAVFIFQRSYDKYYLTVHYKNLHALIRFGQKKNLRILSVRQTTALPWNTLMNNKGSEWRAYSFLFLPESSKSCKRFYVFVLLLEGVSSCITHYWSWTISVETEPGIFKLCVILFLLTCFLFRTYLSTL